MKNITKNHKDALLVEQCLDEKWYPASKGSTNSHCALCGEYLNPGPTNCFECPIQEDTGQTWCDGTPFEGGGLLTPDSEKRTLMIWNEIEYLETLRAKLWGRVEEEART